tara:strand:+ start:1191 stop:1898 length:708 start_codon:yes stop_codon:yes gene_type:complete
MIRLRAVFLFIFFVVSPVWAAAETECGTLEKCDNFKSNVHDRNSLQRGLGLYKNYCSSCHTLRYLRWNRLQRDLDIPENILVEDLINNSQVKTSDYITFGLPEISAIGAPDLTLRTRVRGEEWIYTYLRTFYEDSEQITGSNNLVYPGTAMLNVLGGLQGRQVMTENGKLEKVGEGSMSTEEYDIAIGDLVTFLAYASEPARISREKNGIFVILFFIAFTAVMWLLNREYTKDIK